MHFSIPETKEIKNGFKTFITYLIYINGSFHCSLRYRQLYHFHIQLKKAFGANSLPDFPPKKFLPLNSVHIEERRSQLEKYIQIVSQDSQIINSDIFNGFLLAAQQESHSNDINVNNCIDVYQLDWQPIRLMTNGQENSENVLKKICQTIRMNENHIPYFALYLIERIIGDNNVEDFRMIRRLQNFESPLLTLRTIRNKMMAANDQNYMIIIRKSYFDIQLDQDLFNDTVALNCIYLQAVHDIENGHIICNADTIKRLNHLKMKSDKLEYIRLARLQKFYGYLHFESCHCDLPSMPPKTSVTMFAGNQELIIRANNTDAVLISYCLQSMVEEMLLKREGKKFRSEGLAIRFNTSPNSRLINHNEISDQQINDINNMANNNDNNGFEWNYCKQDGSQFPLSTSSSTTTLTSEKSQNSEKSNNDMIEQQQKPNGMVDPLSQRFHEISLVENN
ncbi:PX domain containing protein, partial [Euroglyphus maynei]